MNNGSPADRTALIRKASLIALFGNALLALAKILVGLLSHSLAVVGDGIDSSTDVVISIMTLAVASYIARPADAEHPWGHARAETLATTLLAFILFFAGGQLILSAIANLRGGAQGQLPGLPALLVTLFSILGKAALSATQYALARKTGSAMLRANGLNMRNDAIMSASVLAGIGAAWAFRYPAADSITAILVGLWVLRGAVGVFREVNTELMDGSQDRESYRAIFAAVRSVPGAHRPHRARMRRIASLWDIDLDIEVDGSMTVGQAHALCGRVEEAIRRALPDVYDIMVHVEPSGGGEHRGGEAFGLCEEDLDALPQARPKGEGRPGRKKGDRGR